MQVAKLVLVVKLVLVGRLAARQHHMLALSAASHVHTRVQDDHKACMYAISSTEVLNTSQEVWEKEVAIYTTPAATKQLTCEGCPAQAPAEPAQ
jgi:hypothetical protein